MVEKTLIFSSAAEMVASLGFEDEILRLVELEFSDVSFYVRGNELKLVGSFEDVEKVLQVFGQITKMVENKVVMTVAVCKNLLNVLPQVSDPAKIFSLNIVSNKGVVVRPKTVNQSRYVSAIDNNVITFGVGPAGTGKTYLAMAKAVQALKRREVSRIILTRPAVEAGERLGFLPGTLHDKIDPYLRPLYDALYEMMDVESIPGLVESGVIEVAPLAYMRGRTLNDAFIILDEAQNTTAEQMKMFLTRLGVGSKMVVTGDVTQIDLPVSTVSGLRVVQKILGSLDGVAFLFLDSADVVRHSLVSEIVSAYAVWNEKQVKGVL